MSKEFFEKRFVKSSLSPSEKAVYEWYINPENNRLREERDYRKSLKEMDEFQAVYGSEEIKKDKGKIFDKRKEDVKDYSERGEIFEMIMRESEKYGWFGSDCFIQESSEYDDRINYTDVIWEFEDENGKPVRLAIDCVVTEGDLLSKKVGGIMKKVRDADLSRLKYFQSEISDDKKELYRVPQVVLAISPEKVKKLCEVFIKVTDREKGSNEVISNYGLQYYLLKFIEVQLEIQLGELKERKDDKKSQLACNSIDAVLSKVQGVIKEKSSLAREAIQRAEEEVRQSLYLLDPSSSGVWRAES